MQENPNDSPRSMCTRFSLLTWTWDKHWSLLRQEGLLQWAIFTIIVWVGDGASGCGGSITCIWFQCFRRARSCFSFLRFGLFWVWFIGFGLSKLKLGDVWAANLHFVVERLRTAQNLGKWLLDFSFSYFATGRTLFNPSGGRLGCHSNAENLISFIVKI